MIPSIVTFKWAPKKGYRSQFTSRHVNLLRKMILRHYPQMERFLCVTDDPSGLDPEIEPVPLWQDHSEVPNPTWPEGPSCYRRLKVFDPSFAEVAGPRFVMLDIDMVPVGDLTPIFERPEPFVIWRPVHGDVKMCASLILMDTGVKPSIWDTFDPEWVQGPLWRKTEFRGSDQGWLQMMLGDIEPGFTQKDGVYSFTELAQVRLPTTSGRHRTHYRERATQARLRNTRPLPKDAKLVIFTGKPDPWDDLSFKLAPWLRQHYA